MKPNEDLRGTLIGHFQLEERLGGGGMGEVYLAHDRVLDRRVAVKMLRADHRFSPELKARFLREARLLSKLGDPAICQVYELIEKPDADFLVLEYVRGRTLKVAAPSLTEAEQLAVMAKIARGLAVAHREGIVHRDLKADNVMVLPDGNVKILDFGVARSIPSRPAPSADPASAGSGGSGLRPEPGPTLETHLRPPSYDDLPATAVLGGLPEALRTEDDDGLTRQGTVVGTLMAMSPEQAIGSPISEASDLYSLGILFQELVTGLPAYGDARGAALWERVARGATEKMSGLDEDLRQLIAELLSFDPRQRPGAELVAARLHWIAEKPIREKLRRKKRWAVAALVTVLLVGLAVTSWLAIAARRARAEADRRRQLAEELNDFMINDLRGRLEEVGRLDLLDAVGARSLAYFEALSGEELSPAEIGSQIIGIVHLSDLRRARGDFEGAFALVRRAREVAARAEPTAMADFQFQSALVELAGHQGQLHFERNEMAEARRFWQEQLERAEALHRQEMPAAGGLPASAIAPSALPPTARQQVARFALAVALHNLGSLDDAEGDSAASRSRLRRSLEAQREMSALPREEREWGLRVATLAYLSRAEENAGALQEALNLRRDYLALLDQGVAAMPGNQQRLFDRAIGHAFFGNLALVLGDVTAAEQAQRRAIAEIDAMAAADPSSIDLVFWQINLRGGLVSLLLDTHRPQEALGWLDQIEPLLAPRLQAANPEPDWLSLAMGQALRRGLAFEQLGDPRAMVRAALAQEYFSRIPPGQRSPAFVQREIAAILLWGRQSLARGAEGPARGAWEDAAALLATLPQPLNSYGLLELEVEILARQGKLEQAHTSLARLEAMGWRAPRRESLHDLLGILPPVAAEP